MINLAANLFDPETIKRYVHCQNPSGNIAKFVKLSAQDWYFQAAYPILLLFR